MTDHVPACIPLPPHSKESSWSSQRQPHERLIPQDKHEDAAVAAKVPIEALREVASTLGAVLHRQCGECSKIQNIGKRDGLSVYRSLVYSFSAQSAMDSCALLGRISHPPRAASNNDLADKLEKWDTWVEEYAVKFNSESLTDAIRMTGMMHLLPTKIIEDKVVGSGRDS